MKSSLRIKKGSKVFIPDIARYRFSSGALGAGKKGIIETLNQAQSCCYVSFEDDLYWYDLSEVQVI